MWFDNFIKLSDKFKHWKSLHFVAYNANFCDISKQINFCQSSPETVFKLIKVAEKEQCHMVRLFILFNKIRSERLAGKTYWCTTSLDIERMQ